MNPQRTRASSSLQKRTWAGEGMPRPKAKTLISAPRFQVAGQSAPTFLSAVQMVWEPWEGGGGEEGEGRGGREGGAEGRRGSREEGERRAGGGGGGTVGTRENRG